VSLVEPPPAATSQPEPRRECCACDAQPEAVSAVIPEAQTWARFQVPTMDCMVEEAEIRRALADVPGIRGLRFQLGQRSLALDAPQASLALALGAIRKAGFDPQPLDMPPPEATHGGTERDPGQHTTGWRRMGLALVLAFAAEGVGYFAPEGLVWQGLGLAVAAVAIWLAGFDVYQKGLVALRRARLNINALMTVAVTGAFAIGQWPEAAMVMALYAIAEAIEARAVDQRPQCHQGPAGPGSGAG
jgi:Cd2+/Zn2+-exporting ATPase